MRPTQYREKIMFNFISKLFGKESSTKAQVNQKANENKIKSVLDGIQNAYFEQAEKGNAEAQCTVGSFYIDGTGVKQSYVKAAEWFRKSAAQDHPEGVFNLGVCYYQGKGVEENNLKAFELFVKARDLGYNLPAGLLEDVYKHILLKNNLPSDVIANMATKIWI